MQPCSPHVDRPTMRLKTFPIIFHVTPHLGTCSTTTARLYNLNRSPHCLQLGFYFLRLFHLDILLYRCRSTLHQLLRLLQPQTSQSPNLLNHLNLGLGIKPSQFQIKHRLFHLGLLCSPTTSGTIPSSTTPIHIILLIIRKPKMIPYTIHKFLHLQHIQPHNSICQLVQMWWCRDFVIIIIFFEWGEGDYGHFFAWCKFFGEDACVFGIVVMEWILPWGAFVFVFFGFGGGCWLFFGGCLEGRC
mmetsp:Transcript_24707/g.35352  ORF Transcript_24707/g.35352 Transcript_24707/m.35352 type:complete len:244 (+) Transcript_24707:109-840(+)